MKNVLVSNPSNWIFALCAGDAFEYFKSKKG